MSLFLSVFLISTSVDFGFQPGTTGRTILFYLIILTLLISFFWLV